jgi:UDPglucose 6-dehydrogenase
MKLSVIGAGYLGATHAAAMASLGFDVIAIDRDVKKIESLARGEVPFYEPGLTELLSSEIASGRLQFSSALADLRDADLHFICVGTPQQDSGLAADLSDLFQAIESLAGFCKSGSLIVGKSTVPVGTAELLQAKIQKINPDIELAWNPEFLREGFAIQDTLKPNRIVVGVTSDRAEKILKEVYKNLISAGVPWIRADLPTAELVKVAANSFLATKISFINAMAEICEVAGGDVTVLAKAIGYDPRIGDKFLQAGIGFGGGCLPKDIRAFMARSEELGARQSLEFLREIDSINLRARNRVIDLVRADLGEDLKGKRIAILGAAFKPDSDDVRDSPALDIAVQLHDAGADVLVHDPKAINKARARFPKLNFAETTNATLQGAELILHLTEWKEYRNLNPQEVAALVARKSLIDGRNLLDIEIWRSAGFKVRAIGRTIRQ